MTAEDQMQELLVGCAHKVGCPLWGDSIVRCSNFTVLDFIQQEKPDAWIDLDTKGRANSESNRSLTQGLNRKVRAGPATY